MIRIYRDVENMLYFIGDAIFPAGVYELKINYKEYKISIGGKKQILPPTNIGDIVREDGTPYGTLNNFLKEFGSFFM